MASLIQFYQQLKQLARQSNHRQLFCLKGEEHWAITQAISIIDTEQVAYKWCGKAPSSITANNYNSLLGQDIELLILNMSEHFDANMFAAAEGAVKGGSIIILILPKIIANTDYFSTYIEKQLISFAFPIINQETALPLVAQSRVNNKPDNDQYIEQQQAIQQIMKTVTGHRRRPLVITANRGRGKSAALGIAAATLINEGCSKILICAPSKQAVKIVYKHASLTLLEKQHINRLIFIAPDALYIEQPDCELLIIDEAAAIPLKMLAHFSKRYSRLVFATTQFGYEGSGRGFALRFQQQLSQIAPQWRSLQLNKAIRWAENDPVEAFTLNSLCLMEKQALSHFTIQDVQPRIEVINKQSLLEHPTRLNQLFSLLINAHYQTKPSDLSALLNDQDLTMIGMYHEQQILAVLLINREGGFEPQLADDIYQGKRRPKGHLIAQSLTFHSGFKQAAMQKFARVQRIAVQPILQNQQLGSRLLSWAIAWARQQQFDHISASFAGSEQLIRFWQQQQFQVLRIGTSRDKSSGQHSFMVNLPLNEKALILHQQIQAAFHQQIKVQLSRQLAQLEAATIIALWPEITNKSGNTQYHSLSGYINANRSYENVEYLLIELLYNTSLASLNQRQQHCLITKVIQNHSWQQVIKEQNFTGQKQAQAFLKNCICELLNSIPREK
ncbi:GNAT family N-acetyltransferase [Psychromonas aquatilis]|uniref:tRNA(Met) cytidine acetyltransferase TmcA n=1 Tax=Psychromonas aquatilis TaxID=2005072 RepID=A0ABU9GMH5_9GAMM